MRIISLLISSILISASSYCQELPLLKLSKNQQYLVTQDNEPFLWLGGTA
jgi:hypothetical protein